MTNHLFTEIDNRGYSVSQRTFRDETNQVVALPYDVVLFVEKGTARIELDMHEYVLENNSRIYCFRDSLFNMLSVSDDFVCLALCIASSVVEMVEIGVEKELYEKCYYQPHKIMENEKERTMFLNFISVLKAYRELPELSRNIDFVCSIFRSFYIGIGAYTVESISAVPSKTTSGVDFYFRNFMKLLTDNCQTQHDVMFYANKLNITPKYLNEICRKKTACSAKEIVTKRIITRLKRQLALTQLSIQEIAYNFNFGDQSSFGKFFKKSTGVTPAAFRKMVLEK